MTFSLRAGSVHFQYGEIHVEQADTEGLGTGSEVRYHLPEEEIASVPIIAVRYLVA